MIRIRIIECFGLEETLKLMLFQPPAMDRDTFHESGLLRALYNLALDIAMDGTATVSLDLW